MKLFKSILNGFLVGSFFFLLCYLLGAFNSTTFDITKWNVETRSIISVMGGLFTLLIIFITTLIDIDKKKLL